MVRHVRKIFGQASALKPWRPAQPLAGWDSIQTEPKTKCSSKTES